MQLLKFTYNPLWPGSNQPTGDRYSSFRDSFFFLSFARIAYSNGRACFFFFFFLLAASCNFRRETHNASSFTRIILPCWFNICMHMYGVRVSIFGGSFIFQGSDFIDASGNARTFVIGSGWKTEVYIRWRKKREKLRHSRPLLFLVVLVVVLQMRFYKKKKKKKFIKKTGLIITYIEYHWIRQNGFFFNDEITLRVK